MFPACVTQICDLDTQGQFQLFGAAHVEAAFSQTQKLVECPDFGSGGVLYLPFVLDLKFLLS
jgi:hypothetical protein